jgi:hypothetical protein
MIARLQHAALRRNQSLQERLNNQNVFEDDSSFDQNEDSSARLRTKLLLMEKESGVISSKGDKNRLVTENKLLEKIKEDSLAATQ